VASAEPPVTGSVIRGNSLSVPWEMPDRRAGGDAMAYASPSQPVEPQAAGGSKVRYIAKAPNASPEIPTSRRGIVRQQPTPRTAKVPTVKVGERINNPWMRAMIVAPSAAGFMSTSLYGAPDIASVREHMHKPTSTVMMTFSADPHLGMTTDQFRGSAVVFVATMTFRQRTAALQ
jgi:hypothetical protein